MRMQINTHNMDISEFRDRLTEKTLCVETFRYHIWIDSIHCPSNKLFYGNISENSFKISLLTPGKHYFTPILHGDFNCGKLSDTVVVKMQLSPLLLLFYLQSLFVLILGYYVVIRDTIFGQSSGDFSTVFIPISVLFFIAYVVIYLISLSEAKKMKHMLEKLY